MSQPKENRTYTSLDVADLAKDSQTTVSRVFAGSAKASKQKKEIAELLQYNVKSFVRYSKKRD